MTLKEVMQELESYGDAQTKKTLGIHGAKEPYFGVKVGDLKKILKKTKKNHELSLELYATGNSDAMYLAGLMADEKKISKVTLEKWAHEAYWYYLFQYSVPMLAAETEFGFEIGLKWIQSDIETVVSCGWSTLSSFATVQDDDKLDIKKYSELLDFVEKNIHAQENNVRSSMNLFVIAIGTYVKDLTDKCLEISEKVGKVIIIKEGTACKVPFASDYINKVKVAGKIGSKRKVARC